MGIFGDIIKDFSEMGSPIGKLRGKFADLSKLLTAYKAGTSEYSDELLLGKILLTFKEAQEIATKCSKTDKVRLYFSNSTLEPSVAIALRAAEYWIDYVLNQEIRFTYSLAAQLIAKAEDDLKNPKPIAKLISSPQKNLSTILPNLVEFMGEIASSLKNCDLVEDTSTRIEYQIPFDTYYQKIAYNHFIVEQSSGSKYIMYLIVSGNSGQKLHSNKKTFSSDQTIHGYYEMFESITNELLNSPQYFEIMH